MKSPSKEDKKRTETQNNALHLYFEQLAQELNDAGLDMRKTLKPEIDIPWNKDTIKNYLWRPIQELQTNKQSTTELSKFEVSEIYDTLNRHISEKFSISVQFPNINEK